MLSEALEIAFKAKLKTYAASAQIAVDWGDEKEYEPIKEGWLRPRLNASNTKPGPTNRGVHRATLTGIYSVECMLPIEDGLQAAYNLADAVADHFMPNWTEPQYLDSDDAVIRVKTPSVLRLQSFTNHNRAVTHIPYLVYAKASA